METGIGLEFLAQLISRIVKTKKFLNLGAAQVRRGGVSSFIKNPCNQNNSSYW